jgi:flagellar biosynthesis anti-sigma factor FlgM
MKIHFIGKNELKISDLKATASSRPQRSEDGIAGARQDRVCLSEGVQRMLEMERVFSGSEDVRAELVERLQKEIREGRYEPDSEEVAMKMVSQLLKDSSRE